MYCSYVMLNDNILLTLDHTLEAFKPEGKKGNYNKLIMTSNEDATAIEFFCDMKWAMQYQGSNIAKCLININNYGCACVVILFPHMENRLQSESQIRSNIKDQVRWKQDLHIL